MNVKLTQHFYAKEFECKCGCGLINIDRTLVTKLQDAREIAGIPFAINSGVRCFAHNRAVGGLDSSSHLSGSAVDIECGSSRSRLIILGALIDAGFDRIGIHKSFIHVDVDTNKPEGVCWLY